MLQRRRCSSAAGIDARLRRIEQVSAARRQAQEDARFSAALRLLSDADLTGLIEWMDTPEGQASFSAPAGTGSAPPAPLWAAWESAWERAGGLPCATSEEADFADA